MSFPQLARLLDVLRQLRGPGGCPWDRQQDLVSAARHLADEVHEYVESAQRGDLNEMRDELGDLLYMVSFSWLLLSEKLPVELDELAGAGADKLVRRKPHVFGEESAQTPEDAQIIWKRQKALEKSAKTGGASEPSMLKDLSPSSSPLRQAISYGTDAAELGFDWPNPEAVEAKLHEEIDELKEAQSLGHREAIADEMGDILFAAVQLARKLGIDPDAALRGTNRKFARRFRQMEAELGHDPQRFREQSIDEMFKAWERAKRDESR